MSERGALAASGARMSKADVRLREVSMVTGYERAEYTAHRSEGYTAREALRAARAIEAFTRLENEGRVRLDVVPDDEPYDVSFVDTWTDLSDARRERIKRELSERADRDGVWGLRVHVACPCCHTWEVVDSIYSLLGDEWQTTAYRTDLLLSAIEAARKERAA